MRSTPEDSPDAERDQALPADAVATAALQATGQTVYLAVEASATVAKTDVHRAIRRALAEAVAVVVAAKLPRTAIHAEVEVVSIK
jgi:hypothetical protein